VGVFWRFGAAVVLVVVTGCGDEATPGAAPSSSTPSSSTPTPEVSVTQSQGPAGIAVADLAKRLRIDAADVKVVSVQEVTWPDASLGCPKPGMMYAQVLTEGSRIVLEANGKRYNYHSGRGRDPFLCEN
jgi:hypothetical protein